MDDKYVTWPIGSGKVTNIFKLSTPNFISTKGNGK